jgi:hypothetical protein
MEKAECYLVSYYSTQEVTFGIVHYITNLYRNESKDIPGYDYYEIISTTFFNKPFQAKNFEFYGTISRILFYSGRRYDEPMERKLVVKNITEEYYEDRYTEFHKCTSSIENRKKLLDHRFNLSEISNLDYINLPKDINEIGYLKLDYEVNGAGYFIIFRLENSLKFRIVNLNNDMDDKFFGYIDLEDGFMTKIYLQDEADFASTMKYDIISSKEFADNFRDWSDYYINNFPLKPILFKL